MWWWGFHSLCTREGLGVSPKHEISRKEGGPLGGSAPSAAARLPGEAGTSAQGRRFGVSCSYIPLLKHC